MLEEPSRHGRHTSPVDPEQRRRIERDLAVERSLPDGLVEGTDIEDWQRVLDLLRTEGWTSEWGDGQAPDNAVALFAAEDPHTLKVWPTEGLQVNVFPLQEDSVDFDFDSRELTGVGLDACFAFLRRVGRALGKPVLLKHEGFGAPSMARYDPEVDDVIATKGRPR